MSFCKSCGKLLSVGAAHCGHCGVSASPVATAATTRSSSGMMTYAIGALTAKQAGLS